MMNGGYEFDVLMKNWMLDNVELNMGGMHNVENAVAAIIIAHQLGIENNKIKEAIKNFKGVKRRFEYVLTPSRIKSKLREAISSFEGKAEIQFPASSVRKGKDESEVIFIDDYAHHPEELKALIRGAKSLFSGKKCTIVFQPHLYSRTRDLAKEFAESLDMADEVILLPIYPARELPIEDVSSELILIKMNNENVQLLTKEELLEWTQKQSSFEQNGIELLITAGAGDIDQLIQPLKNILNKKNKLI
jgi:UDP-N-acetylmuramate--alanine ligase